MSLSSSGATIVAHRGGAGYAPENTLSAFERTLTIGSAEWMEFDVQRSEDGELFVFHDADLTRTTNVRAVYPERADLGIGGFTAAELSRLDTGSWFDPLRFAGEKIPTLSETLDVLKFNCGIMLELKNGRLYPGIEEQLAEELRRHGLDSSPQVSVWSFELDVLERFRSIVPALAIGAFGRTVREVQHETEPGALAAVGTWPELSEEDVLLARREETPVIATTLNSIPRMLLALARGADGIVTDYPDVLRNVVTGTEPFPVDGRLVIESVLPGDAPSDRSAVIRNPGPEPADLASWYLRHGVVTALGRASRLLRPGEQIELPFALSANDTLRAVDPLRGSHFPLALHDSDHRLIDLVEY